MQYRLTLQEGRKCLAFFGDSTAGGLGTDHTHRRWSARHKAHSYNTQGQEGQTVSGSITKQTGMPPIIAKPFTRNVLLQKLSEALELERSAT